MELANCVIEQWNRLGRVGACVCVCECKHDCIRVYVYLSVTSHINCIVARCLINVVYLTACCLYQVMMTLHFLSDVANDAESTQKSKITS